jgi:antitoxin (DNA-binding transcriptional repressor) of toxin-antitoxin stability system
MPTEVGAFEAKTKFSELLRKVELGERFTVTRRGKVIAELAQPKNVAEENATSIRPEFSEEEREAAYQRLRNPRISGVSGDEILEWIREGRK